MTRVADTSALYALFDDDDAHAERARREVADPEPILVPAAILAETIDLVEYRLGHEAGVAAAEALLGLPHVRLAPESDAGALVDVHRRGRGRLSFADSAAVHACRTLKARPLSFDREVVKAAR